MNTRIAYGWNWRIILIFFSPVRASIELFLLLRAVSCTRAWGKSHDTGERINPENQNQDVNMTLLLVNIAYGLDHGGGDSSWQRPDEGGRVKLRISDGRSGSPVIWTTSSLLEKGSVSQQVGEATEVCGVKTWLVFNWSSLILERFAGDIGWIKEDLRLMSLLLLTRVVRTPRTSQNPGMIPSVRTMYFFHVFY